MDTSQSLQAFLLAAQSLALPAAVFAGTSVALRRLLSRPVVLGTTAVAGLIAGWAALFGPQAAFPPVQTLDWLPGLVCFAALASAVAEREAVPSGVRWLVRLAVLAAGLWLLTPPLLREQETLFAELAAALGLGIMLSWASLRPLAHERGSAGVAAALAAAFGSLAFVTSLGGSLVVGGLANAAFAIAAVAWLGLLLGRIEHLGPGAVAAAVAVWAWLAFSARHLAEIPLPEMLLSAAALAAVLPPPRSAGKGLLRSMAATVLYPALPALIAVGITVWRYFAAQSMGQY